MHCTLSLTVCKCTPCQRASFNSTTDSFSWCHDPYTLACKARPSTDRCWTSLSVSLSLSLSLSKPVICRHPIFCNIYHLNMSSAKRLGAASESSCSMSSYLFLLTPKKICDVRRALASNFPDLPSSVESVRKINSQVLVPPQESVPSSTASLCLFSQTAYHTLSSSLRPRFFAAA